MESDDASMFKCPFNRKDCMAHECMMWDYDDDNEECGGCVILEAARRLKGGKDERREKQ